MGRQLYLIIVGLVFAALVVNVYFSARFMKLQRRLRENRIPMSFKYVFDKTKREEELFPHYEKHRDLIEEFSHMIWTSIKVAAGIFIAILIIGFIFIYF